MLSDGKPAGLPTPEPGPRPRGPVNRDPALTLAPGHGTWSEAVAPGTSGARNQGLSARSQIFLALLFFFSDATSFVVGFVSESCLRINARRMVDLVRGGA